MAAIISILCMIGLDQLVKYLTLRYIAPVGTIPLINNVFHLTYIENRGAAFSILQGRKIFFVLFTVVIVGAICYALWKKKFVHISGHIAAYMIIGGAIGNLIDRLARGYVVDTFDFRLINFPVFNVADIFIVCGSLLFIYYVLTKHPSEEKK